MYLQNKLLYCITFVTIYYLPLATSVHNKNLVATRTGLGEVSPCAVGLRFFAELNNTGGEDYFVELISDECCIHSDEDLDCNSVEIIGDSSEVIQKGTVKTFTLVAPVLDPYERKGYCVIHVDSRPVDKRDDIMRDTIKIYFDTTLESNKAVIDSNETIKKCKHIDEDPLNDCKPVNCDTYYNGNKPIYDENTKRCREIPKCENVKSEFNTLFDPISNRCIDGDPIDSEDIDCIKSITKERHPKDIIIIESTDLPFQSNSELVSLNNNTFNTPKAIISDLKNKFSCESIMKYITGNKYTLFVMWVVIFVQCCLIFYMIYCLTKKSVCCDNKKVERKYFNYRQDSSITTPLIGTSNIDTEATGFDYVSESSNIDKKIKCYKACQKERTNDAKISMSDDILSKCLNRRDWNTKPKSDIIRDVNNAYFNSSNAQWDTIKTSIRETTIPEQQIRVANHDVTEETQKETNEEKDFRTREYKEDYGDSDSSEKLIQCHDYNMIQSRRNISGSNNSDLNKKVSMSTEKGAQAYFSNDTVDDFLSEKGMTFLAGETLSKYSFGSNSTANSAEGRSSRTSKNNIVKNVLSFLSKRSKKRTHSDPGTTKPKGKDLELIHMSRASMYSSSSEYKNLQGFKLAKDSKTLF